MSELRLVILDACRSIQATRAASFADRVVAALSAEPETIEELDRAVRRYEAHDERSFFSSFSSGTSDEPYDAGLMIIDLEARLVVCQSTYSYPGRTGSVSYHNGRYATDTCIRYHLPDDWEFTSIVESYHFLAERRRLQRREQPALDARGILYGKPMLSFIGSACWKAFREAPKSSSASEWEGSFELFDQGGLLASGQSEQTDHDYELAREIHAQWLLTQREDLRGEAPRDVVLAKRAFIESDLQDRQIQWSDQQKCPPGLDRDSHAFRLGGFGTHEIVLYYYLVRALIYASQRELQQIARQSGPRDPLDFRTAGDFLSTEVPRLEQLRDKLLETPDHELHAITPRAIIEHERARIPEGFCGKDAVVDKDCPACQMMADLPGPMFWHLDGCNMDTDFAFSFHRTFQEWENEERAYEEISRRFQSESR